MCVLCGTLNMLKGVVGLELVCQGSSACTYRHLYVQLYFRLGQKMGGNPSMFVCVRLPK